MAVVPDARLVKTTQLAHGSYGYDLRYRADALRQAARAVRIVGYGYPVDRLVFRHHDTRNRTPINDATRRGDRAQHRIQRARIVERRVGDIVVCEPDVRTPGCFPADVVAAVMHGPRLRGRVVEQNAQRRPAFGQFLTQSSERIFALQCGRTAADHVHHDDDVVWRV